MMISCWYQYHVMVMDMVNLTLLCKSSQFDLISLVCLWFTILFYLHEIKTNMYAFIVFFEDHKGVSWPSGRHQCGDNDVSALSLLILLWCHQITTLKHKIRKSLSNLWHVMCFSQPSSGLHNCGGLFGVGLTLRWLCKLWCFWLSIWVCKNLHEEHVLCQHTRCCKCLFWKSLVYTYVSLFCLIFFFFSSMFLEHGRWFPWQTGYYNLQTGLSMILLAMSMVMSGTGNLKVLQLCRFLHKRTGGEMNYGFHMAHHMALGLLFLGGGR